MPLPLLVVPIAVGVAAATASVVALVSRKSAPKPDDPAVSAKKVAILGARSVGKTTLLRLLEWGHAPIRVAPTMDPTDGGQFELEIGGRSVAFDVPRDVPGDQDLQFKDWRRAVAGADHIWYLFRADQAALGLLETAELLDRHVARLEEWLSGMGADRPVVTLIGTHADVHPAYTDDPWSVGMNARNADIIKVAMLKLDATTVTGSLCSNPEAQRLVTRLIGRLA